MTEENATPDNAAQPDAAELIAHLEERLGQDGLKALVVDCLRASDRVRAVQVINAAVGTVRLPASTDRGRMGRLIMEGLGRRRDTVLDAVQTLSRDPFEWKAEAPIQQRLDEAVDELNKSREPDGDDEAKRTAAVKVVGVLRDVLDADETRRLLLLNAYPDVLDHMLAALDT
jgi:hypothetical protein